MTAQRSLQTISSKPVARDKASKRGFCCCCCCCLFFKSGIDKSSTEGSTIPSCSSLTYIFNRDNTERITSSKMLFLMFVYVCFVLRTFVSGLISWIFRANCDLMTSVQNN